MRTLMVATLTLTLVTGSAVGVTAQEAEPADRSVAATQRACGGIPASEYTGPGYYLYEGGPDYRWCDFRGKWVGPKVDVTMALIATLLVWLGADPRVFRYLSTWTEPGDPTKTAEQGSQIDPVPIIARALMGEEPFREEPSQNYRLTWGADKWISFNGRVTGSGDRWRYESEGEPILGNMTLEQKEGAEAECTLGPPSPFQHAEPIEFYCKLTLGDGKVEEVTGEEYTDERGEGERGKKKDFDFFPKWDSTGLRILSCTTEPILC